MNRSFITNDCLAYFMYHKMHDEYLSPFIGSLFEDDAQYVKFCKNFTEYIKMKPVFGEPLLPVTKMDYQKFPIMFLGDIEIHWPHEQKGEDFLLNKFNRRLERMQNPLFIWSDMQTYNIHSQEKEKELKDEFKNTPDHLFVNKDDIEEHRDKFMYQRSDGNGYLQCVSWLNYNAMADHVLKVLGSNYDRSDVSNRDFDR